MSVQVSAEYTTYSVFFSFLQDKPVEGLQSSVIKLGMLLLILKCFWVFGKMAAAAGLCLQKRCEVSKGSSATREKASTKGIGTCSTCREMWGGAGRRWRQCWSFQCCLVLYDTDRTMSSGFFWCFFGRLHTICSLLPILALKRKGQFVGLVCYEGKHCRLYNSIRGVKQKQLWPFPRLHWCLLKVDESDLFPTAWRCRTMSVEKYHNGLAPANFFMPTL